jgi:hypothetical protein
VQPEALAVWFTCDDAMVDRKLAALRAQASQLEPLLSIVGEETYRELLREESFRDPQPDDDKIMAHVRSLPLR